MFSYLSLFIGLRYTRAKRRNGFIAFVSMFAMLGMALGVFAIIVVMSVMNGFDSELKNRTLRLVPHGFVYAESPMEDWPSVVDQLKNYPNLSGVAPYIEDKVMLSFQGEVRGFELHGILPELETSVSEVNDHMLVGSLDSLAPGEYGIALGLIAARILGVNIGDKISVTLPKVSVSPMGVFPRTKRFTVVAVFEVGAQVDQNLALIHITDAQKLFRTGTAVEGLRLRFNDIYQAPANVSGVIETLGPEYQGKDWSQTQGSLFQAVKMEKIVVGVMLSIIIAVAAFNIVTSLIMMVAEKRSNIAVLRTLGVNRPQILGIFIVQGVSMGLLGIAVGCIAGIATALFLSSWISGLEQITGMQLFDPNVYFVSYLPSIWVWQDTVYVCAFACVVSFLATIYPAYRASLVAPAEALRYDM